MAQGTVRRLDAGRRAAVTAAGRVGTAARTAWTALAHRRALALGVGAGVTALSAASFAAGRRSGRVAQGFRGPLTRLTGGRI
ncbi:hypothetical protein GCM10020256_06200 [Streptomyces thermocoprophilus]